MMLSAKKTALSILEAKRKEHDARMPTHKLLRLFFIRYYYDIFACTQNSNKEARILL